MEEKQVMAVAKKEYKSTICAAEKIITRFEWVLKDWNLLYDCHYSKGVQSSQFLLNGTDDITWKLHLKLSTSGYNATLQIRFSQAPTFLTMVFTASLLTQLNKKPMETIQTINGSAPKVVDVTLPTTLAKNSCQLKNDVLLISVEFIIVKAVINSSLPDDTCDDNFRGSFRHNLKTIFDSKNFYDVTFVIGDEKLYAHKVILAAKSEVFKAMFLSGMKEETENVIEIIETDAKVFEEFLNYIYVGKVNGLDTIVDDMIFLADKYQIEDLKSMCGNYMSAYLDTENVVKYLLVAYKLCCNTLKNKALELIKANMHILKNENNFNLLGKYPPLIQEIFST